MKTLITGGLGFIGSNLAKRLVNDSHEVIIVDSMIPDYGGNYYNIGDFKSSVKVNISDIRDSYSLSELLKGVDVVYNLAAQTSHSGSMEKPFVDLEINSMAQLSLLENIRKVCPDAVVIYTSTRQIYGRPKYLPVDEKHQIRPVDVNGVNKHAGEQFHTLYNDIYGIRTACLRLTNTYGPGMRIKDARQTFLGIWLKSLIVGDPIYVFGDGTQLRDFNYVDDVVEALVLASQNSNCYGKSINLGSSERISLEDLAIKLCALKPSSTYTIVPFPEDRKAIDIGDYYSNHDLASKLLKWEPQVGLDDGLTRSLSYYQENLAQYL